MLDLQPLNPLPSKDESIQFSSLFWYKTTTPHETFQLLFINLGHSGIHSLLSNPIGGGGGGGWGMWAMGQHRSNKQ